MTLPQITHGKNQAAKEWVYVGAHDSDYDALKDPEVYNKLFWVQYNCGMGDYSTCTPNFLWYIHLNHFKVQYWAYLNEPSIVVTKDPMILKRMPHTLRDYTENWLQSGNKHLSEPDEHSTIYRHSRGNKSVEDLKEEVEDHFNSIIKQMLRSRRRLRECNDLGELEHTIDGMFKIHECMSYYI